MKKPEYSYSKLDEETPSRVSDVDPADGSFFRHADPEKGVDDEKRRGNKAVEIVKVVFLLYFIYFMFFLKSFGSPVPCQKLHSPEDRARKILSHTPLIGEPFSLETAQFLEANVATDGHNDLPILIRFLYDNHVYGKNFTEPFEHGGMTGHVDLPRLREGQNGGAFWSVFVPCPANGTDFSDENYAASQYCSPSSPSSSA